MYECSDDGGEAEGVFSGIIILDIQVLSYHNNFRVPQGCFTGNDRIVANFPTVNSGTARRAPSAREILRPRPLINMPHPLIKT